MKSAAVTLALLAVMASTALAQVGEEDVPVPVSPFLPGNSGPDVYLSARAIDIGLDVSGNGRSINPTDFRSGNYAFMGERIIYVVVVRDLNGAQDIQLVKWVMDDGDEMGPCTDVTDAVTGDPPEAFYCFNRNRGDLLADGVEAGNDDCDGPFKWDKVEIDRSTNLQWDPQTDKLYKCVLTVESQWEGSEIKIVAEDTAGLPDGVGESLPENWNFNPPLEVVIDTSDGLDLSFGPPVLDQDAVFATEPNCVNEPTDGPEDLAFRDCIDYVACDELEAFGWGDEGDIPGWNESIEFCEDPEPEKKCDVSFSTNKLIITNPSLDGVNLWAFIASENFYVSEGLAKCPFTNELHANQFEYRATSGSYDSGWRLMPQYSPNLPCIGVGLGNSEVQGAPPLLQFLDLVFGQCRGGCRIPAGGGSLNFLGGGEQTNPVIPGLDILSPGQAIEVALKIVWPTPCIGSFDEGNFHVLVRAV